MPIQHHLEEATLMAYATGNLPEAFSLLVASHVSLCDTCRATAESYDAVGGAMIETTDIATVSDESLQQTLARIELPVEPVDAPVRAVAGTFPAPLQHYAGGDLDAVRWRAVGGGVKQAILETSSEATARLLSIPAGASMPHHSHKGREMTLVLQGAFVDDKDHFRRGDVEVADDHVHHQPVADIGGECICLVVTEAPLRFKGLLPSILQKFAKI